VQQTTTDEGRALSLGSALGAVAVSVPLLAPAPLSGDGLEIAGNVVRGGVLHPPGFVLQGWLHALLGLIPGGDGTRHVEALGLLGLGLAAFFLGEALRLAQVAALPRVAAVTTFAFFPTVWPLSLTPEVFSLAHACIAANLWLCVRLWQPARRATTGDAALLGLVVGLSATQHPITVVAAPAFLGALAALLREPAGRAARFVTAATTFFALTTALFVSLPWLSRDAVWPDWSLSDARDVVRHVLRADYGTFRLGDTAATATLRTSLLVLVDRLATLPVHGLLALVGVVAAARAGRGAPFVAATAATAVVFLQVAGLPPPADPYLERFHGVLVLPAAFLVGLALQALLPTTARGAAPAAACAALAVWTFVVGVVRCDLSDRREQDVYRRALGASLPPDAVWIAGNDREVLGGAALPTPTPLPTSTPTMRYPVNAATRLARYWRDVAPLLEPRLVGLGPIAGIEALRERALAHGLTLVSTDRRLIDPQSERARLRGLLWVVDGSDGDEIDAETVRAALALCPFVAELSLLPPDAPGFGILSLRAFARAFDAAAVVANHAGDARAPTLRDVAGALHRGDAEDVWRAGCRALRPEAPQAATDQNAQNVVAPRTR